MAIRQIVTDGDSILRKKCRDVTAFDQKLGDLLDDMRETLDLAQGLGLAGPQVGVMRRVCLVLEIPDDLESYEDDAEDEIDEIDDTDDTDETEDDNILEKGEFIEFVNPVITSTQGEHFSYEGCLSFPGRNAAIDRPLQATVVAFDRHGNKFERTLVGINARCICHECDHLNGVTILDLADHFLEDVKED